MHPLLTSLQIPEFFVRQQQEKVCRHLTDGGKGESIPVYEERNRFMKKQAIAPLNKPCQNQAA
ncbi:MAG: hypothetical protein IJ265_13775 [Oscillospiraceae bacterium]|nr:hypothetical protein [Oscillospiraceae bacterium]